MDTPNFYKGLFNYYKRKEVNLEQTKSIKMRNLADEISGYLIDMNKDKMLNALEKGEGNEDVLLKILSDWSDYKLQINKIITFVGVRITTYCNLIGKDKCIYCDQRFIPETTSLKDYKIFLDDLYNIAKFNNFYFSISGGEPLLWGEDLYGENGLIKYIHNKGSYINMNSDLHLLNTDNVIKILTSGLDSLRVSFDVSDEFLFDEITTKGAFKRTLFSIMLIIKFKELFAVEKPKLFYNVVGTKVNLNYYEELIDFLINFVNENVDKNNSENIKSLMNIHLIPLGGEKNKDLMPLKEDWQKFIYETIPNTEKKWSEFLSGNDINIFGFNSFANPMNVEMYNRDIDSIIDDFVNGSFNKSAKRAKCYCAPTQIYVLPNGDVYPCGIHAESADSFILGNIKTDSISTIIERNIDYLNNLPNKECDKCPISTIKINVQIEKNLKTYVEKSVIEFNSKREKVYD